MREFADDELDFSSFAEMVGLTRSLDLALASRQDLDIKNISTMCANVDAILVSWTYFYHRRRRLFLDQTALWVRSCSRHMLLFIRVSISIRLRVSLICVDGLSTFTGNCQP